MTPEERVERLVRSGAASADEGKRLLAAIHREPARTVLRALLNPFERIGGGHAVVVGAVVSALSVLLARTGVRFDGFLDMHLPHVVVSTTTALADQLVAWPLGAVFFYAYARVLSSHVRFVDFLGMAGFARIPVLVVAALMRPLMPMFGVVDPLHPPVGFLVVAIGSIVFVIAHITLLFQGFKNASGFTGAKLVAGFIGLTLLAEIASKLALSILL